ncbi:thiamine pyrophosphate-dependent enzyme, partial [Rhizobium johnstonii]
ASVQTTMKELSTAIQHQAPIKIFFLSDEHPGMAREWGQVPNVSGRSRSYSAVTADWCRQDSQHGSGGAPAGPRQSSPRSW